jgi:transcriptional regulator NrdR family protein
MICPECKSDQVHCVDSRPYAEQVRRRRECTACGRRFNTIEIPLAEYETLKEQAFKLRFLSRIVDAAK